MRRNLYARGKRRAVARLLTTVMMALLSLTLCYHSAQAVTPVANPDLSAHCGLDIVLVLDESGSLADNADTVRTGVRTLLEALADTGSRLALVEFNLDARTPLGADYIDVTSAAVSNGVFDLYLDNNYQPNGFTNWDAAFTKTAEINQNHGVAPLVIFFTDSEPTVYINAFGSIVGSTTDDAVNEAAAAANVVKTQGSHIFVVGVEAFAVENRLVAIAGPDRYPDQETRFARADYTLTNFAQLAPALRQIAFNLCGPSVTVTKYVNGDSGPQPVSGQSFSGAVAVNQAGEPADAFTWTQPVSGAAAQVGTSQNATTGSDGAAQWQWTPGTVQNPQPWASTFVLDETAQPGYFFGNATCNRRTLNLGGGFTTSAFTLNSLPATIAVGPSDLITCSVTNERLALVVQKSANPTSVPEAGGEVTFTFHVTNYGTAPARLTGLIDSAFGNLHGQGDCVADGSNSLAVGAGYQCTVTKRIAGNMGTPHTNTVTATLRADNGVTVSGTASATVTFRDSAPTATMSRGASPNALPEPGGSFVYSVAITNTNAGEGAQLLTLTDSRFGNVAVPGGAVTATTCALPRSLTKAGTAGAVYRCQFTATVTGAPGIYSDSLSAVLHDDDSNAATVARDASVTILNVPPAGMLQLTADPTALPEPGGIFTFTASVTNQSTAEALTLTTLNSTLADLAVAGTLSSTCQTPQTLAPSAVYQCTLRAQILQNSGTYAVSASATLTDDDGGQLPLQSSSEIEISDVPSSLLVTKQASQTTIAEPGGPITFTVTVRNTSAVDTVVVAQVVDDIYSDLAPFCTPALPATLQPGAALVCRFDEVVSGNAGDLHVNEVTATALDDDGHALRDSDEETVEITDVPSQLAVTQIAQPANIPEPGGPVTVTTIIKNISTADPVTIHKVETNEVELTPTPAARATADAVVDISGGCMPALPVTLAPGEELHCTFMKNVVGAINQRHSSQVMVTGQDDENLAVQQTSREAIDIIDVPSAIRVTERSNPVSVPEAGGPVTFTVRVQNTSRVDTVTVETLTNSRFGDLEALCPGLLPATLLPGAATECTYTRTVSGDLGALIQQQTAATATDDDGQAVADSTQSAIGVTDTPSSLRITQVAQPSGVDEPGREVTFTVRIRNTSPVDAVTIEEVTDSLFGPLNNCTPGLPVTLMPAAEAQCQFSAFVGGNAATVNARRVTVRGVDDDAVAVNDFDVLTVDILDVAPNATLLATATPNQLLETGATVAMSVTLVNHGPEVTTLTVLSSTIAGDLNGLGSCVVPQTLAANGGSYRCGFSQFVDGVAGNAPLNNVTAFVRDDEGNEVQLNDEADLFLLAADPVLELNKDDTLLVDLFDDPADEGVVTPGDTLRYVITVRNAGNGVAQQVLLSDTPDPNSALIVGSVTASKGTVIQGNSNGDSAVLVLLGDLAIGESATVRFDVLITEGTGTTLLRNQAFLSYSSSSNPGGFSPEGSDDPNTPFLGDPTDTRVTIPPTNLDPEEEPVVRNRIYYLPVVQR
jgi:uncharacterized repeat protein (TIGR01451 family)